MTLNEFINKRCAELGITRTQLLDRGNLSWATLSNIGKGVKITTVTKEKLARGLQCTIGDINACLTDEPNPLRKEAATPEGRAGKQYEPKGVMATVDKLEKMVSEKPYVTPLRIQLMRNQQKCLRTNRRRILIPWCWRWKNIRNNGGTKLLNISQKPIWQPQWKNSGVKSVRNLRKRCCDESKRTINT